MIDLKIARGMVSHFIEHKRLKHCNASQVHERNLLRFRKILKHTVQTNLIYANLYKDIDVSDPSIKPSDLPIVNSQILQKNLDQMLSFSKLSREELDNYFSRKFFYDNTVNSNHFAFHTSGSSGNPSYVTWNKRDFGISLAMLLLAGRERKRQAGGKVRFAYIGVDNSYVGGNTWAYYMKYFSDIKLISIHSPFTNIINQLNDFQPTHIASKPHIISRLAKQQLTGNLKLLNIRNISVAGENITPIEQETIFHGFRVWPYNSYSTCETGPIAKQLSKESVLNVYQDQVMVEVLDTENKYVQERSPGRVVITNLYNYSFPTIRYDTGDVATQVSEINGFSSQIGFVSGRTNNCLNFKSNRGDFKISETTLSSLIVPGIERFQVLQTGNLSAVAFLSVRNKSQVDENVLTKFKDRFFEIIRNCEWYRDINVTYKLVTEIQPEQSGKIKLIKHL